MTIGSITVNPHDFLLLLGLFGLGAALARADLCFVAAAGAAVHHRNATTLRLHVFAICSIGVAVQVLRALGVVHSVTPMAGPGGGTVQAAIGGAVLAVGFLLNGGCFLGTLTAIGRGNPNFLLTFVGVSIASRWNLARWAGAGTADVEGLQTTSSRVVVAVLFAGVAIAIVATFVASPWHLGRRVAAVSAAASTAAVLFVLSPDWSSGRMLQTLTSLQIAAGAVVGCMFGGLWKLGRLQPRAVVQCLVGGYLMSVGASLVPGGSDRLLLSTIPQAGWHGVLAYIVCMAVLLAAWRSMPRHAALEKLVAPPQCGVGPVSAAAPCPSAVRSSRHATKDDGMQRVLG